MKHPYEIWSEQTWDIYDPVDGFIIAKFYDEDKALAYLNQLNQARQESEEPL